MNPEQERRYAERTAELTCEWRQMIDARIEAGWAPEFAFSEAADKAARVGTTDEATIIMMTQAAAFLVYPSSDEGDWAMKDQFRQWWNARFIGAPRLDEHHDFATPCFIELGDVRAAFAATWSSYCASLAPEKQQS